MTLLYEYSLLYHTNNERTHNQLIQITSAFGHVADIAIGFHGLVAGQRDTSTVSPLPNPSASHVHCSVMEISWFEGT